MRNDAIAVNELYDELVFQHQDFVVPCTENYRDDLSTLINRIYDKYYQLSNARKELFVRRVLAGGTKACLTAAANRIDPLTKEFLFDTDRYISMIQTIKVRDKYNGAYNAIVAFEIAVPLNDIKCPREIFRFFHRRNSCDCLQSIYYMLKETTERTSFCWNCKKSVEIRNLSRCQCKVANYCSYGCALAHWPNHREQCKEWRKPRELREKSDSSDNRKGRLITNLESK